MPIERARERARRRRQSEHRHKLLAAEIAARAEARWTQDGVDLRAELARVWRQITGQDLYDRWTVTQRPNCFNTLVVDKTTSTIRFELAPHAPDDWAAWAARFVWAALHVDWGWSHRDQLKERFCALFWHCYGVRVQPHRYPEFAAVRQYAIDEMRLGGVLANHVDGSAHE